MRCALVKKENGKLTAIVATMPRGEIRTGAELANLYYKRWPSQEARFKEMTRYFNLKVNHGFKKKAVFNRMAAKKLKNAEKSLNYDIRRLNNLQEKQKGVKRQMEWRMAQMEKASEKLECQIETIRNNIREQRGNESKLRMRVERRNRELETEMDHIMTNFKILHENSLPLCKRGLL